jgi:hypothetical protein
MTTQLNATEIVHIPYPGGTQCSFHHGRFVQNLRAPLAQHTFLLLSFKYFLPKTTQNISEYAGSLKEEHFPLSVQKHAAVTTAHSHMIWQRV